jgi:PAS domain S-box-containing protein
MQPQRIDQQRIGFVAGAILIVVTVLVGIAVFYIMQRHAENLLRQSLQTSLQNQVALTKSEIQRGFERNANVATRPLLINQTQLAITQPGDPAARTVLNMVIKSFIQTGLSAITLLDNNGNEVAHAGTFIQQPALAVPLGLTENTQLLFKEKFFLRTEGNMVKAGRIIARVVTETPLPALSDIFSAIKNSGKTADLAICASSGANQMRCFPTTLTPRILVLDKRSPKGVPLPMTHALEGEKGFIIARDYRHQEVVAAYSPIDHLGLGMVLKMDSDELYAPVWNQLRYLLPLIIAMLAVALLLLRWLLTPLVTELVRSERAARAANVRLRDSENRVRMLLDNVDEGIVSISSGGRIELFNPGAERMFGYRSADILGENISILMPDPYRSEHDGYLERYLHTGETHVIGTAREVTAQRSNGDVFPMELRISEFELDGQAMFIGIMHDITERKATQ